MMVGTSKVLENVRRLIEKAAKVPSTVMITGESGVGKELAARSIHESGSHCSFPFVTVNCAALPDSLIESELFGHVKGAFTGAVVTHIGAFERANGGTIFLDEIGDMSLLTQSKILRVLQERVFYRVGGQSEIKINVRVVAATNKKLADELKKNKFREDLFYRLMVIPIFIPPLRKRKEDIVELVNHFWSHFGRKFELKRLPIIKEKTYRALNEYPWPGNVRELINTVERTLVLHVEKEELGPDDFFSVSIFADPDEVLENDLPADLNLRKRRVYIRA